MRIDTTRQECQAIIDALGGQLTKSQRKVAEELRQRLEWQLRGNGPDDPKRSFVPMRSSIRGYNFDGMTKPSSRSHWSYKPRSKRPAKQGTKVKQPKPALSAQDILNQI